jgi:hypothetical protein
MVALYKAHGIHPINKWVDNFLFLCYPVLSLLDGPLFLFDLSNITDLANSVGWLWKPSKTHHFAPSFLYLGFLWDLPMKSVEIPPAKCTRFLSKLIWWVAGFKATHRQVESMLGTLAHCSLTLPDGRSRLPAISRFMASFSVMCSHFTTCIIPPTALADITWWRHTLETTACWTTLQNPPPPSHTLFTVDASTSWGISIIFRDQWEAWHLDNSWKSQGRDIGWAKIVTIERGLRLVLELGHKETCFIL